MGLDASRAVHARMGATLACPVDHRRAAPTARARPARCSKRCCARPATASASTRRRISLRYNERVRIDGRRGDRRRARRRVRRGRGARIAPADGAPMPLTYFEFGTLAALWLFARARLDVAGPRSGPRRPPRRGQHRRRRRRGRHQRRSRPHGLPRPDARGHRPRKGGHLPRRPTRRSAPSRDPPRVADRRTRAALGAPLTRSAATTATSPRARSGATGAPAAAATACRIPALRGAHQLANAATALAALDMLRERAAGGGGAVRDGLVERRAAGPLPGAAGPARRSCSTSRTIRTPRACSRRRSATMGFHPRDASRCSACSPTRTSPASSRR